MFTGIVEYFAVMRGVQPDGPGRRLEVACSEIAATAAVGDSIAVNGCCLTVVELADEMLAFQAGDETLSRTNLGELVPGHYVNLETSLRLGDQLGGHLVTGHIDAVGTVLAREDDQQWSTMWFGYPERLSAEMAEKGSIAVDGVSLTLVSVQADRFSVALIPHTLQATTLGLRQIGAHVNLETDILAKYVARRLALNADSLDR